MPNNLFVFPLGGVAGPSGPDIYAATRVVSLVPGEGTDLTIAAAIAALPAEGGLILVREGTYPISATIMLPSAKPVTIRGCGNSTIISLGANAIPAFKVPSGYTINTPICFDSFKVTGTEVAAQTVLEYADANSLAEIYIENVDTVGVQKTINITDSSFASSTPGQDSARFHMAYCRIRPISTDTSIILSNPSVGVPRTWMKEVEFIGDSMFAIPALRTAPLFGRIADDLYYGDLYMDSCEMSVGFDRSDFNTLETVNTTIRNNDPVNTLVSYFTHGSADGYSPGTLEGSTFQGIDFVVFEGNVFVGCQFTDCDIQNYGAGAVVTDCNFLQHLSPYVAAFVIQMNNENSVIKGNRFDLGPALVIDIQAPTTVIGNDFSNASPNASGVISVNNADCVFIGNRFKSSPTTFANVQENIGGNYWTSNSQLWNLGGLLVKPNIPIGKGSTVDCMYDSSGSFTHGAGTQERLRYRNPYGLAQVKGYIENTGANNWTLTETFVTQNLGTFTRVTTPVTPGTKITLDPFDFTGIVGLAPNNYQVIEYRASVTTIVGAATCHVYFAGPCGVNNA